MLKNLKNGCKYCSEKQVIRSTVSKMTGSNQANSKTNIKTKIQQKQQKQQQKKQQKPSCIRRLCIILRCFFPFILILITIADQSLDFVYIAMNWHQFPTVHLRNLTMFFSIYQTLAISYFFLIEEDAEWIKNILTFNNCQIFQSICQCITILLSPLLIIPLAAMKIHKIVSKLQIELLDRDQRDILNIDKAKLARALLFYTLSEAIFQSAPQLALQWVVNSQTTWSDLDKASTASSIATIVGAQQQVPSYSSLSRSINCGL